MLRWAVRSWTANNFFPLALDRKTVWMTTDEIKNQVAVDDGIIDHIADLVDDGIAKLQNPDRNK